MRPTIVLVHGAFAESASWDGVVEGASHAMPVSRPDAAVHPILEAAALRVAA
jgi:pimeloyl-ACP methyl ester carboxylesterase